MEQFNSIAIEQYNNKKIAFGDNLKVRFSVVRKVLYTFLHHKKGVTLIELLIAVCIFAVIAIGFSSISTFSQYHVITSDRRAKLQNDASYVLEDMAKNLTGRIWVEGAGGAGGAVGDVTNPTTSYPVSLTTIGSNNAVVINIDYNNNGKWDGTTTDRQIAYSYSGAPNYQIWYYPPYQISTPGSPTVLTSSRIRGDFSATTTNNPTYRTYNSANNYIEVQIGACWTPSSDSTCGTPDNPSVTIKNRINMPAVSIR